MPFIVTESPTVRVVWLLATILLGVLAWRLSKNTDNLFSMLGYQYFVLNVVGMFAFAAIYVLVAGMNDSFSVSLTAAMNIRFQW